MLGVKGKWVQHMKSSFKALKLKYDFYSELSLIFQNKNLCMTFLSCQNMLLVCLPSIKLFVIALVTQVLILDPVVLLTIHVHSYFLKIFQIAGMEMDVSIIIYFWFLF